MAPGVMQGPEHRADLLGRLQAVSAVARTSADAIIDGLFPEQASFSAASRLLSITAKAKYQGIGQASTSASVYPVLSPPKSGRRRKRRSNQRSTPLLPLRPLSPARIDLDEAGLSHAELALALWDAKMERQELSRDDLLFLLLHEDTTRVLESARLLRLSRISYEQVMELELTLDSMRNEGVPRLRAGSRQQQQQCAFASLLSRNVWMHQKAFGVWPLRVLAEVAARNCAPLPVISQVLPPTRATSSMRARPAYRVATALPPPTRTAGIARDEWDDAHRCIGVKSRIPFAVMKPQQLSIGSDSIGACSSFEF